MDPSDKARIIKNSPPENYEPPIRELPYYPDTCESGETYGVELAEMQSEASENEAIAKARQFLDEQRHSSELLKQSATAIQQR